MKKKFLLPIIAVGITACMGLVSCSSEKNNDTSDDTNVTTESNVDSDEDKSVESNDPSEIGENKSSDKKDSKSSNAESKKNETEENSSKKSGSESKIEEKSSSDNSNTKSSENKVMSKTDAVNKILAHETSGAVPKYCIPVRAVEDNYSTLEKSEGSNAFLCNDDNKLDNGILVELPEFNGGNDSNNFVIRDYDAMKNGGKGLISSGSISNSGDVQSR